MCDICTVIVWGKKAWANTHGIVAANHSSNWIKMKSKRLWGGLRVEIVLTIVSINLCVYACVAKI